MTKTPRSEFVPDSYMEDFMAWRERNDMPLTRPGWSYDEWLLHLFAMYLATTRGGGQLLHDLRRTPGRQETFDFNREVTTQ